ncbi:hypothetical protein E8E14_001993 [Neopestalotiopsis sp. 37M]|nr:hypothetical protein E8E14_001993 [Neopestalotiopsis sp. 37M]
MTSATTAGYERYSNVHARNARWSTLTKILQGPMRSNELLDSLHRRLCAVEESIRREAVAQNSPRQSEIHKVRLNIQDNIGSPQNLDQNQQSPAESILSIEEQTKRASQASELTSINVAGAPHVTEELAALRAILREREGPIKIPCDQSPSSSQDRGSNVELPPSEFAIRLLRTFATRQSILALYHPVDGISQVEELCKRIYFPFESLAVGEITLFNGFMTVLLRDVVAQPQETMSNDETEKYYALCRANFEHGIKSYDVMLTPSYQHTLALSIAMVNAQIDGNEVLFGKMASAAAQHCLALGYHREQKITRMPPKEAERARRLFWHIYIFDKNQSLRLGRAPVIQDFDIDVERPEHSEIRGLRPWSEVSTYMIEFSSLQARIYQLLYSPSAFNLDPIERQDIVSKLSAKLTQWYSGWCKIDGSAASRKEVFDITFLPMSVIYHSVLTLLLRGANASNAASDITPACFEAARSGLQAHLACYQEFASAGRMALSFYSSCIPLLNPRKSLQTSDKQAKTEFVRNAGQLLRTWFKTNPDKPARLIGDVGNVIVLPPHLAQEIRNDKRLDFAKWTYKSFHAHLPGFDGFREGVGGKNLAQIVITKDLTKLLNKITKPLAEETILSLEKYFTKETGK